MIDSLRQSISLGPFGLPVFIIPLLIAWIIYQIVIKRFYRDQHERLQRVDRIMFNALFIVLIVWKLSPLVFQFSTVIKNPLAALYLPGGFAGVLLGMLAAIVYGTVLVMKIKDEKKAVLKALGFNLGFLLLLAAVLTLATGLIVNSNKQDVTTGGAAGSLAPGFSLEAEDGGNYQLSDYSGRTVVLNFWASWCPPCKAELPELKTFYEENSSGDVVFLSINLYSSERDPAGLSDFIKNEGLTFPVLYDVSGEAAAKYGVESIPTTVIIGPDGVISDVKKGAVTEAWLKRAVAE